MNQQTSVNQYSEFATEEKDTSGGGILLRG